MLSPVCAQVHGFWKDVKAGVKYMLTKEVLSSQLMRIGYAKLLKMLKTQGLIIRKLKIPERISSHMISARIRTLAKKVFQDTPVILKKNAYYFDWSITPTFFTETYNYSERDFNRYLMNHPTIKQIESKYGFTPFSSSTFTVFITTTKYSSPVYKYNENLLSDLERFSDFIQAAKKAYFSIKKEWQEKQKRRSKIKGKTLQELYDKVARNRVRESNNAQSSV
jgi:hypothetical protein